MVNGFKPLFSQDSSLIDVLQIPQHSSDIWLLTLPASWLSNAKYAETDKETERIGNYNILHPLNEPNDVIGYKWHLHQLHTITEGR